MRITMRLPPRTNDTRALSENMKMQRRNRMKSVSKEAVVALMGVSKMMRKE